MYIYTRNRLITLTERKRNVAFHIGASMAIVNLAIGIRSDPFRSVRSCCPSKEYDRYLRLKDLSHNESIHTNIHGAERQKLINDISLRAMSGWDTHGRLLGFLLEEDPGLSATGSRVRQNKREKERGRRGKMSHRIQWLTLWTPVVGLILLAALTPGNAVPPSRPSSSASFSCTFHGVYAPLIWPRYRLILLHFIFHQTNKRATCDRNRLTSRDHVLPSALCPRFPPSLRGNKLFRVIVTMPHYAREYLLFMYP